ncbi:MAG TPA: DUF2142 domain-containing protein, partial [Patescibacteria group bacterium]|nr:DUF2142 domain-containing protein [Patescibacteria group bacterium]
MFKITSLLDILNKLIAKHAITIFVCVTVAFGGYFVLATPPFMGIDEAAHFFRITQLSKGQLLSDKLPSGQYGGLVSSNIDQISRLVIDQLPKENQKRHVFRPPAEYYDLLRQAPSKSQVLVPFTGSAVYSPVAYLPMIGSMFVVGKLDVSIASTIFILRITNLIAFLALGILSLWLVRSSQSRWFVLAILLLPMSLFEAATINGDAILIGLTMLFFSALVRYIYDEHPSRKIVVIVV